MAWQPLSTSLSSRPHVLAGPLLRKVTGETATVWVALRTGGDVTLTVLNPSDQKVMKGKRHTVALGTNLHVVAVTARIQPPFAMTEGTIYRYDLLFDYDSGLSHTLKTSTVNASLAYPPLTLPSFCMPPSDVNTLRLIHGSCRIPSGQGPDALALLDDLIEQAASDPTARPHQLILSGDQIYADDVAPSMLVMLTDASDTLLGWQENLPVDAAHGGPLTGAQSFPFGRRKVLEDMGFTSEDLDGHLMTFGEYVCMYLFVWSDVLWDSASIASFADVSAIVKKNVDSRVFKHWERFLENAKKESIAKDIFRLKWFRDTIPKVRRALANIPSYMIFDDHEITDDWNMTLETCEGLYTSALGQRIVQNGLAAYAICQHWGNCPEQFDDTVSPPPPGLSLLRKLDKGNAATYESNSSDIKTLVAVHDITTMKMQSPRAAFHDSGALAYNYTVEGPGHQVIVTDTRTWRTFPRAADEAPDLLTDSQLRAQILNTPPTGDRALLVVVTTNAPPVQTIRAATANPSLANKMAHYPDLFESWELAPDNVKFLVAADLSWNATDRLYRVITDKLPLIAGERRGRAMLLSGDVHTSFASRMDYRGTARFEDPPGQPQPVTAILAQLVASSLRKQTGDTINFHRIGYEYAPSVAKYMIPRHNPEGYAGWNTPRSSIRVGNILNGHRDLDVTPPITINLQWFFGSGADFTIDLKLTSTPDYRYRLDYLVATNQAPLVGGLSPIPPTPAAGTPAARKQATEAFNKATGNYRVYNKGNATTQQMIGLNNIAEITFDWGTGDNKKVNHTLRWRSQDTGILMFTTYTVSLDPNDANFPPKMPGKP